MRACSLLSPVSSVEPEHSAEEVVEVAAPAAQQLKKLSNLFMYDLVKKRSTKQKFG